MNYPLSSIPNGRLQHSQCRFYTTKKEYTKKFITCLLYGKDKQNCPFENCDLSKIKFK